MVVPPVTVFGRDILNAFLKDHADVRGPAASWLAEVEDASWKAPQEVRARYPTVSFIGNRAVFNLKGTKYRLDVRIAFGVQVVEIVRMGTHAEYSHWTF